MLVGVRIKHIIEGGIANLFAQRLIKNVFKPHPGSNSQVLRLGSGRPSRISLKRPRSMI